MIFDAKISELTSAALEWERAGYFAALIVAVGCLGEYIHEIKDAPIKTGSWWVRNGGKISARVLIAALVVEVLMQVKTNTVNGQISDLRSRQTAEVNKAAAALNDRAAGLEKEAATARLELHRLQDMLGWREVTEEQSKEFIERLRVEPSLIKFVFRFRQDDPEAKNFAHQLENMCVKAGYEVVDDGLAGSLPDDSKGLALKLSYNIIQMAVHIRYTFEDTFLIQVSTDLASKAEPSLVIVCVGENYPKIRRPYSP